MDYGELHPAPDGRWQLRFIRWLPHRPAKVWRALTEPAHLRAWFPCDIEGERTAGAALRFVFREAEAEPIAGQMLVYDEPDRLEFRWGDETLEFVLRDEAGGTELTFVNTFGDLGKAARDAAGWHLCLDCLAYEVDEASPPWKRPDRWKQVHGGYVERFGPEASAIGPPASRPEYAD